MTDCRSLRERYFPPGPGNPADPEWTSHLQVCAQCRMAYEGLPQVDRALRAVAQTPVSVPAFETIAVAAAGAARQQRRRRAVRRSVPFVYTGFGAAALAAGLVAAVWIGRVRELSPKLLAPGVEMQATTEAKSALLGHGVRIRLDSGSVKLAATSKDAQTLLLSLGRVFVDVPKLPAGNTLSVRTPDAEVRVRGTRFHVIRTSRNTQVQVMEGVVEVRPEGIGRPTQTVRAGESATIASAEDYRKGLRQSTLEALDHGEIAAAEQHIGQLLGSSAAAVHRAEAQALLGWTLSARGKRNEAILRYREALVLLPAGLQPLWAENACAEMALLVEQASPKQAALAWAECLRRFPNGVHAALARSRLHSTR
ncbi:MAG: FecR domain-containing protein [Deltaproteobacteria bacterium]|nr:FecR domain-containing protein [Deltaproteobacteria bacterium]